MIKQQPTPEDSGEPDIQPLVIADLNERHQHGIEVYGQGLKIRNKRDMTRDAYEEALDLSVYLRGEIVKREQMLKIIDHLLSLHDAAERSDDEYCKACDVPAPCHTRVDLDELLILLGAIGVVSE